VSLLIQIIGSALILAAFTANQIGNTGTSSRSYLAANAIGSLALAVSAQGYSLPSSCYPE
jgi:hypothetical protein